MGRASKRLPARPRTGSAGVVIREAGHVVVHRGPKKSQKEPGSQHFEVEQITDISSVLSWPSGMGTEFGTIHKNSLAMVSHLMGNLGATSSEFQIAFLSDEGAEAVLLKGLADTPICLTSEPEMRFDRVAVIADASADATKVNTAMRQIFGDAFHPSVQAAA